jgi:hypothetical protein
MQARELVTKNSKPTGMISIAEARSRRVSFISSPRALKYMPALPTHILAIDWASDMAMECLAPPTLSFDNESIYSL